MAGRTLKDRIFTRELDGVVISAKRNYAYDVRDSKRVDMDFTLYEIYAGKCSWTGKRKVIRAAYDNYRPFPKRGDRVKIVLLRFYAYKDVDRKQLWKRIINIKEAPKIRNPI